MIGKAPAPRSVDELRDRARGIVGIPLGALAEAHGMRAPADLKRHKGWIGDLAEVCLGADGGALAGPDFAALGVELKTVPLDARGVPRESTWVCVAPYGGSDARTWEDSGVRAKLAHVLWMPVVGGKDVIPADRTFAEPVLWRPTAEQEAVLRGDYEAHVEALQLGELWRATGRHGEALQLRPKALEAGAREWVVDGEGEWASAVPMGFYLRASFTRRILTKG